MSTKSTVSYGEKYHFYEECFETDGVYLDLHLGGEDGWADISFRFEESQLGALAQALLLRGLSRLSFYEAPAPLWLEKIQAGVAQLG